MNLILSLLAFAHKLQKQGLRYFDKQETRPILLAFKFFKGQQMDWFSFILA